VVGELELGFGAWGFRVQGSEFRAQGSGFRFNGLKVGGLRVEGLGSKIGDSGFGKESREGSRRMT
jgi:hypothetical protein